MRDLLLWKAFWNLTITGLALGSIYALIALGYTLVYGVLRLINFAHSEVFMVGTIAVFYSSTKWLGIDLIVDGDYPYKTGLALIAVLAFVAAAAMVFSGAAAVAIERVAYRPMRGSGDIVSATVLAFLTGFVGAFFVSTDVVVDVIIALVLTGPIAYGYLRLMGRGRTAPRLAFLITAIGASTAIAEAVAIWGPEGREQYQTPRVLEKKVLFSFFDADVRVDYVLVIVLAIAMMIGLTLFVGRTRIGRGVRAVAQDVETARLMGVNVDKVIMITFLLGGVMAGGAAVMFTVIYDQTALQHRFPARYQVVHRGRARWHRQPQGRAPRRVAARPGRELQLGDLRQPVEGRCRVRRASRRVDVSSDRIARRITRTGARMTFPPFVLRVRQTVNDRRRALGAKWQRLPRSCARFGDGAPGRVPLYVADRSAAVRADTRSRLLGRPRRSGGHLRARGSRPQRRRRHGRACSISATSASTP